MSLLNANLQHIHKQINAKEIKPSELVEASLQRVKQVDKTINAFITIDEEGASAVALRYDEAVQNGEERSPLFGLPAGIKDNIVTDGLLTTAASQILSNHVPVYDATVMQKLKAAQVVTVGKLNMDELGMGSTGEHASGGAIRNPWQTDYVAGGSSGGAAAAVAAGEVYFALGSDTGGGVRQPAAYCGVVGMKPTYGLVSRFGLIASASSLDHIGTLTKNVEDAAYVLEAIAGHDKLDSTSSARPVAHFSGALDGDIKGLKIGVPKQYLGDGVSEEIKASIKEAIRVLEQQGAICEEVSLPHAPYAPAAYHIIAAAEASSNLARLDGVRYGVRASQADDLLELYHKSRSEGIGSEAKRRIILGAYALSEGQYQSVFVKAQQTRTLIKQDFESVFNTYDVLLGPTAGTTAYRINTKRSDEVEFNDDLLTVSANLAGLPALSLPCGFANDLPIGLHLIGKPYDDATVLKVAHVFEQSTDHHTIRPKLGV